VETQTLLKIVAAMKLLLFFEKRISVEKNLISQTPSRVAALMKNEELQKSK
jgi:hypothetical protein